MYFLLSNYRVVFVFLWESKLSIQEHKAVICSVALTTCPSTFVSTVNELSSRLSPSMQLINAVIDNDAQVQTLHTNRTTYLISPCHSHTSVHGTVWKVPSFLWNAQMTCVLTGNLLLFFFFFRLCKTLSLLPDRHWAAFTVCVCVCFWDHLFISWAITWLSALPLSFFALHFHLLIICKKSILISTNEGCKFKVAMAIKLTHQIIKTCFNMWLYSIIWRN